MKLRSKRKDKERTNDTTSERDDPQAIHEMRNQLIAKTYISDIGLQQNMMSDVQVTSRTAQRKALKKMDLEQMDYKILKQLLRKSIHIR